MCSGLYLLEDKILKYIEIKRKDEMKKQRVKYFSLSLSIWTIVKHVGETLYAYTFYLISHHLSSMYAKNQPGIETFSLPGCGGVHAPNVFLLKCSK